MDALVTDANIRSAVAGIRGLGRAGVSTLAVAPHWASGGLWSAHAAGRAVAPDSSRDPVGFARAIHRLAERDGPLVVYPGHEDAIEALVVDGPAPGSSLVLPFPLGEALAALRDKRRIGELAERAGLLAPATLVEASAGSVDPAELPLPCVVKPARTRLGLPSAGIAMDAEQLGLLLQRFPQEEPVVVQEFLAGEVVALAVVVDRDGRLVARFQQTALETWPRDGGLISLGVSVAADDQLSDRVARMLAELGYFGLVQLDLIDTGRGLALIDANPRFYASMMLAQAAGANLAAEWHAVVTGNGSARPAPYRTGVRFRWFEADLKDAMLGHRRALLRRGEGRTVGAMWDRHDPVPSALLAATAAVSITRNRLLRRPLPHGT